MKKYLIRFVCLVLIPAALCFLYSCKSNTTPPPSDVSTTGIPNLLRVHGSIYSGGEPSGDQAFAQLAGLGIKTIVSVDGATPNITAAKKYGMRYIHIPIGYDRIPDEASLALTRVLREVKGGIYFHCHHGKHRGPAAVAIGCIGAGVLTNSEASGFMKKAGTGAGYEGLWRDVNAFKPPAANAKFPELVEAATVPDFAAAMASMSRICDNLTLCSENAWQTPQDHPDLSPTQEALMLWETIRETRRLTPFSNEATFQKLLESNEDQAKRLKDHLSTGNTRGASEILKEIRQTCKQCHNGYRNKR